MLRGQPQVGCNVILWNLLDDLRVGRNKILILFLMAIGNGFLSLFLGNTEYPFDNQPSETFPNLVFIIQRID
jgi:hypothetical protein